MTTLAKLATRLPRGWRGWVAASVAAALAAGLPGQAQVSGPATPYPVLFVTQTPVPADFTTIGALFGNHRASLTSAARGGDLWIRYGNGTLRNLTQLAGFGSSGFQGTNAIAVREPSVHWSGTKALFSMVVGATTQQYRVDQFYWQIYEITGLGPTDTPVITRVPNQPATYNNVSPIYGTDDRVIFTSDLPRSRQPHHYPQHDEYESAPVVSGLWSLDPATGDLFLVQHSPSGSFSPMIDSFGRLVYIRWDHLQRDQQGDAPDTAATYGAFNYASEAADAARLNDQTEVFPERRQQTGTAEGHTFNDFFPWQVNEDGTDEETLNHLGRHELHSYFNRSFNDDANLREFIAQGSNRTNPNSIVNFIHIEEDPTAPGTFVGIDAPEFSTHSAGQVIKINAAPSVNAESTLVTYVTHRDTASYTATPSPNHSGLYRNPVPLSNGTLIATHTAETRADANTGTRAAPGSRYDFRIKTLRQSGGVWVADVPLTSGIVKTVSYWDPDVLVSYTGPLWELDAVEVRPRTRPARRSTPLQQPELDVFSQQGVSPAALQSFLRQNGLALIVSRNVTTRDRLDKQQPFNLHVAGTSTQSVGTPGRLYDISRFQIVQADQLRGLGGTANPRQGRRPIAQYQHDGWTFNPQTGGPPASVAIANDGSVAAFVPARRALSWQLLDPAGTPVVRERYWVTMQPGEVRVCTSCHQPNTADQQGRPMPANQPEALRQLLSHWKANGGAASLKTLSVSRTGAGSGTVASSPVGVSCGAGCSAVFAANTVVTLAASPAAGSSFAGWSGGGCSGTGLCTVTLTDAQSVTASFTTAGGSAPSFRRYLAEGSTGSFFDTRVSLANAGAVLANVVLTFLKADGTSVAHPLAVPPLTARAVTVESIAGMQGTAFSTVIDSSVPVAVDRSMSWGTPAYGSHAETALANASLTWYLAEGATHSGFELFYLLQNPSTTAASVTIRYLRPSGTPLEKSYSVPAGSRMNVWVDQEQFPEGSGNRQLAASDVSAVVTVTNNVPIIVERAMYLTTGGQTFRAGHESAGVTAPATRWFFAEGATGSYFDLYLLVANPGTSTADIRVTYLLPTGQTIVKQHQVGANRRFNIWVDAEDTALADTAVSAIVESTNSVPIVAERAMWWPGPTSATWSEAHNSAGSTATSPRWALADGEVGADGAHTDTYVLIANTSATAGQARVTLLFEDGTAAVSRTYALPARSRTNVDVRSQFTSALGKRFATVVESIGAPVELVVERAMYANAGTEVWAAGSNVLGTPLP